MATKVEAQILALMILRSEKGMSQRELGELAGFTGKYISKIEVGEVSPKLATVNKLAEAMGATLKLLSSYEQERWDKFLQENIINPKKWYTISQYGSLIGRKTNWQDSGSIATIAKGLCLKAGYKPKPLSETIRTNTYPCKVLEETFEITFKP